MYGAVMSDDELESSRRRAQGVASDRKRTVELFDSQAREAARNDLPNWKQAIEAAINRRDTSVTVPRAWRGGVHIISEPFTLFGNMRTHYGWNLDRDEVWRSHKHIPRTNHRGTVGGIIPQQQAASWNSLCRCDTRRTTDR